ncbi:MAG: Lipoprotein E [Nitrospirae bacterium]|nr:MAG: putative acid phosphatase, class B [Nitrospira sp. OLB3]MBV6469227.1 Lipoprotein E [Nitrospirota bacterium]MCE7964808.1 hypothetical protein [Nitrospira sp. NTP2]MEB2337772.1 hypothetical protein [Nitrospirales bacterium]
MISGAASSSILRRVLAALCILTACTACAERREAHEVLNALLWMQTSAEYRTLTTLTYRQATAALDLALGDKAWTAALEQEGNFQDLPPAVVLDLDETVLDNQPFDGRLIKDGTRFTSSRWEEWVNEADARALPGSLEFITEAQRRGIAVFFITNRRAKHEALTRRNLERLGLTLSTEPDAVLSEGEAPFDWPSDKSSRRRYLAERYRILLLIGDDLRDFVVGAQDTPEARMALAQHHRARWGVSWFLIPNPMYGTWETALFPTGSSDNEALAAKRAWVRERP